MKINEQERAIIVYYYIFIGFHSKIKKNTYRQQMAEEKTIFREEWRVT
jgi:hypothetical protein